MEELTRRAALGAVAAGAVAIAAGGAAEALPESDWLPNDAIPASFGRLIAATGAELIRCIFEAEDGTIRVVGMYMGNYGKVRVIHEYIRT